MPSRLAALAALLLAACGTEPATPSADATYFQSTTDGGDPGDPGNPADPADLATVPDGASPQPPCTTRITYGNAWMHPAQHPASDDLANGAVTWDGTCTDDGANSYALFSNGWKPYFQGHGACVVALDQTSGCGAPAACTTRVRYGSAWLAPANHAAPYDDVTGRVFWDGTCHDTGAQSYGELSNGWAPHFTGTGACALSFSYTQCGGLYANAVIPHSCPDPGVLRDGKQYLLTCTSGGAANAFPLYTSTDLVTWTPKGHVLPSAAKPAWATGDFWAPEIHQVGNHYVAYFSARNTDGKLSIGAASSPNALGPYTALAQPLVHDPAMGLIDANEMTANGTPYLLWKEDGNAVCKPTPIHGQALAADGLSLSGVRATLITNDQPWEGALVEGPFLLAHAGMYYLFYSANAYYDGRYAVGIARSSSPLGPFVKATAPIVTTGGDWVGPGHCSVVDTPAGDSYMVYHAWQKDHVNGPGDGRLVLTDAVVWQNGWPSVPTAPSSASRPMP